jgi:hypothetical protein
VTILIFITLGSSDTITSMITIIVSTSSTAPQ